MSSNVKTISFLLAFFLLFLSSGCAKSVPDSIVTPEPAATEEPVICVYPVLAVDPGSDISSRDALIEKAKNNSLSVLATGRCRLAAAALCALEDIRFSFIDSGSADVYVFLPDEIPDGLTEIGHLDLPVYVSPSDEQEQIYSQLEDELKYYLS